MNTDKPGENEIRRNGEEWNGYNEEEKKMEEEKKKGNTNKNK